MRSLWRGSISFGLVNIPVRLYAATEDKSVRFNLLHRPCLTRIQYQKRCPHCGVEARDDEIARGYEYDRGRYVVMEEEDFSNVPTASAKQVEILDFVSLAEIDPIYYEKSYYLEPIEGAQKAYGLLRQAMATTEKIAIAKATLRAKQSLACVRVHQEALVMETMFYPEEIRSTERLVGLHDIASPSDNEMAMAVQLIDNLSKPFDPGKYRDEHREALLETIQKKIEGQPMQAPRPAAASGAVIDLMEALEASIQATSKASGTSRPRRKKNGVAVAAQAEENPS